MVDKQMEEVKQRLSVNDQQLDHLRSQSVIFKGWENFSQYHIIATVTRSERCSAKIEVGQQFVMKTIPMLLLPESTAPYCLRALAPIVYQTNCILQMIADGATDETLVFPTVRCMDPGLEDGGLGTVVFKLELRKVAVLPKNIK